MSISYDMYGPPRYCGLVSRENMSAGVQKETAAAEDHLGEQIQGKGKGKGLGSRLLGLSHE